MGLRDGLRATVDRWTSEWFAVRAITPQDFNRGLDIENLFQSATGAQVTLATALTLPVFSRCVNLYVDDIAQLPVDAYRKVGKARVELEPPEWMRNPALDPNYSWGDHISDVVFSLVTDRNAFIRCYPDRFRPIMLEVLDPEDVDTRTQGMSVVYTQRSTGERIPPDELVHIRAAKSPGRTRATSRVETLRETIGLGLAAEQYGARFFRNNATPTLGIEVPAGAVVDADRLKKEMERNHKGLEKSHAIGVLTGGATFRQLSIDADKAQLLGLKEAVVEDVARDFGIPPYLVGSTSPGAVAYASTSNARIDYVVHGVVGIVDRLETAYSSLLPGDDTFVRFSLNALLRGDQPTRFAAYQVGLQNRFIKVDEVRGWEDWEPFGGDDGGFLETPNNTSPGRSLLSQFQSGLITETEARAALGRAPIDWGNTMSAEETATLISQVQAGLLTEDEARAKLGLGPIQYPDSLTKDETETLIAQFQAGLLTEAEAREVMKRPPIDWGDAASTEDIASLIEQVKAGLITEDEARERLNMPPREWADGPSLDEITALVTQVKEGLLTIDEARASLGRPAVQWPEDLSEKVNQASDLIKAGFDPADVLAKLGLPPIKHLGLPPVTVQKEADAGAASPTPDATPAGHMPRAPQP